MATREVWRERLEKWKQSGVTAAEYASRLGVTVARLKWWRWRLGPPTAPKRALARKPAETITKAAKPAISPLTFVEMTEALEGDRLEVVLPSSVRIRVRPGFDSPTLGQLLDVLEAKR
jgi:hypothetical protein